jgi:folate-dependent phosphoribosylglycinamide formyltransferase PurN
LPTLVMDHAAACGRWSDCTDAAARERYSNASELFHDTVLERLREYELRRNRRFDLAVLAYRRIIRGGLLDYFGNRMLNQHPADLSVRNPATKARKYIGIGGHARELREGRGGSRTSTILVDAGTDTGSILTQGPWVAFSGDPASDLAVREHEELMKRSSDPISLEGALVGVAKGMFSVVQPTSRDGQAAVFFNGKPLPYSGLECTAALVENLLAMPLGADARARIEGTGGA